MAGFRIGERERAEIVGLFAELGSVGAVATAIGRHRNTVRRVLAATPVAAGPAMGDGGGDDSGRERPPMVGTLGEMEQRLLQALLRSAQLHICRDPTCRQEFATFAMETKSGKRLRAFCPACGRGSIVRIQARVPGCELVVATKKQRPSARSAACDEADAAPGLGDATSDPGDA